MTAPAQPLELVEIPIAEIARPNHSLILADANFMSTLKQVEGTVASIKITDAQSAQQAADLLTRLTKAGTALEKQRVALKSPYLTLMTQIDAAAKGASNRIDAAKRTLSKLQTDFAIEQARIAREAEEQRKRDLAALEAKLAQERKDAEEKARKIAEELAAKAPVAAAVEEENFDECFPTVYPMEKTETEKAIEAVKFAPAPAVVKPTGLREVVTLFPHLVDINIVPDMFVTKTLKLAALQSTFCRSHKKGDKFPECPGIRFEEQITHVSTGKAGF